MTRRDRLPERTRWRGRVLTEAKHVLALRERVQPYEQAGIPDEFYGLLLSEAEKDREQAEHWEIEAEGAEMIRGGDSVFHRRFPDWLRSAGQSASQRPTEPPTP
jgi:hypothetical protein